jgi:hypothetical protein
MTSAGLNTQRSTTLSKVDSSQYVFEQKRRGQGWRNQTYENREFVAWDGEGWTEHTDPLCLVPFTMGHDMIPQCRGKSCIHHYCLFGNSKGGEVSGSSLSTLQCFRTIMRAGAENPFAIHIGFAFGYDVDMILRDLPQEKMVELKEKTETVWKGYRIEHIPKKWFTLSGPWSGRRVTVQIQDIFSFFACSFVKALRNWHVGTEPEIAEIESGKDSRNVFRLESLGSHIRPYWQKELRLLVDLGNQLRAILYKEGLTITRWFGPGNIATFLYKKNRTAEMMDQSLKRPIIAASQYAYAGGRFEAFKAGHTESTVYSADINSAYPHALSLLPNLQNGTWFHTTDSELISTVRSRVALVHINYSFRSHVIRKARHEGFPFPLFHRRQSGQVWYPERSKCWYHAPEFHLLLDMYQEEPRFFSKFEIVEAWIYEDDGTYPFTWIQEMYQQRLALKEAGDPAEKALKLGINSLYGKLAQRIGHKDGKAPKWHQLEWAGGITSYTRAALYRAALYNWQHIVGVETDGIYSTIPLSSDTIVAGKGLGEWETKEYSGLVFLQNGVYWLRNADGVWEPPKSRGIPQKQLSRDAAMDSLQSRIPLRAQQQYFIGYGTALHRGKAHGTMPGWRTWGSGEKTFEFGGNGKRKHDPDKCPQCAEGMAWHEGLHTLSLRMPELMTDRLQSEKHKLHWLGEDPLEVMGEIYEENRFGIIDA